MTGIEYPTITIGEHKNLTVRFSLAAQLLMRRRGIDPAKIGLLMAPKIGDEPNPDAVQNTIIVFSCCVVENFLDPTSTRVNLDATPTADYWAVRIDDFTEVERAVWASLGKAVEERRKRLAVVPPAQEAAG